MKVQAVGCSHHQESIAIRERLAFGPEQTCEALAQLRREFPRVEAVLLSTCNRVELYMASEEPADVPPHEEMVRFCARFHEIDPAEVTDHLWRQSDREVVNHLFRVAASLDSMVVGESQILSQVKQAYQTATEQNAAGPLTHAVFQAALRVARRVAGETALHQHRVSIPSVAVADFAQQIFERFDDKQTLVIGAGEMAEETLRYLKDEGAREVTVVNRSPERAESLAARWQGQARPWEELAEALVAADLVISTTGAGKPIIDRAGYERIAPRRYERPLFVLDLAVPRDFDPAVGEFPDVYLYSIDDLQTACQQNRQRRDKELPAAARIVDSETEKFMAAVNHRATGPLIRQLKQGWQEPKEEEIRRLFNKLPDLDQHGRDEVCQSFDRLINKLLHPPLESLRDESRHGIPHALLDALAKLFRLRD